METKPDNPFIMKAGQKNLYNQIERTHHWQRRDIRWWGTRALEFVIMGRGLIMIFLLYEILEAWIVSPN